MSLDLVKLSSSASLSTRNLIILIEDKSYSLCFLNPPSPNIKPTVSTFFCVPVYHDGAACVRGDAVIVWNQNTAERY